MSILFIRLFVCFDINTTLPCLLWLYLEVGYHDAWTLAFSFLNVSLLWQLRVICVSTGIVGLLCFSSAERKKRGRTEKEVKTVTESSQSFLFLLTQDAGSHVGRLKRLWLVQATFKTSHFRPFLPEGQPSELSEHRGDICVLFPREHPADTGLWNQTGLGLNLSYFAQLNLAIPHPSTPRAWDLEMHAPVVCTLNELVVLTLCKGPGVPVAP